MPQSALAKSPKAFEVANVCMVGKQEVIQVGICGSVPDKSPRGHVLTAKELRKIGGSDGTRTRGLLRDRQAF